MAARLRRTDTLWLRLACLREDPFAEGVPWRLAPTRFAELERRGLVEPVPNLGKGLRAVATEEGRRRLTDLKLWLVKRNEVANG